MLEQEFAEIYTKFKMSLYSKVFKQLNSAKDNLSAVEVFCVEVIYALGRPTINEFANFASISLPNATYKIGNLIRKGYVTKTRSETDKREFYLDVTDKYRRDYGVSSDYMSMVTDRIRKRFSPEKQEEIEDILHIINEELMPEIVLRRSFRSSVGHKE